MCYTLVEYQVRPCHPFTLENNLIIFPFCQTRNAPSMLINNYNEVGLGRNVLSFATERIFNIIEFEWPRTTRNPSSTSFSAAKPRALRIGANRNANSSILSSQHAPQPNGQRNLDNTQQTSTSTANCKLLKPRS